MKKKAKTSKSSPTPKKPITRFHFTHKLDTDRRDLRSPRQPPCERVNGADTAAPHIGTHPSFRGSSHAGCPENCCPLRSRVWLHSLGHTVREHCGWHAGTLIAFAEGSCSWITSSVSTGSIYASWNTSQNRRSLSARKLCLPPYRGWQNRNTGPPGYRPLRYTRPRLHPVVGNCHTYNVG
jgi:hypothetical protein